jgi:hypothetical protein
VVARVGSTAITQTDVRAAVGLGVVTGGAPEGGGRADAPPPAVQQLIDRHVILLEVARFPPADPPAPAVDLVVAGMKARAGEGLEQLMRATGYDDARLRDLARDTLRIQAYIDQRFGTAVQVSEGDVRRYYDEHPEQFRRGETTLPYEEVQTQARRLASDERLRATVNQWVSGLRGRADVVVLDGRP